MYFLLFVTRLQEIGLIFTGIIFLSFRHSAPALHQHNEREEKDVNFVIHWLNNKDFHFSLEAERILDELNKKAAMTEKDDDENDDERNSTSGEGMDEDDSSQIQVSYRFWLCYF